MSNNFEKEHDYFSSAVDEYCLIKNFKETDIMFNLGRVSHGHEISRDVIDSKGVRRYLITEGVAKEAESILGTSKIRSAMLKRATTSIAYFDDLDIFELAPGARSLYKLLHNTKDKPPVYSKIYTEQLAFRAGRLMRKLYNLDENCFGLRLSSIIVSHNDENITDDTIYKLNPPLIFEQSYNRATKDEILELENGKYAEYIGRALIDGFEGTHEQFGRIR